MATQIALLADIHGNLVALEAVLDQLARESDVMIVCLGDVVVGGPQPRATLARLHAVTDRVVMGNTDAWALDPQPLPQRNEDSERIDEVERWSADRLSEEERHIIRSFQPTVQVVLGSGQSLLAYHGSPRSFDDAITALTPTEELDRFFSVPLPALLAGGHTHEPFVRRYRSSMLINPGSVGRPFVRRPAGDAVDPTWAEYALLRITDGGLQVSLRRVPYPLADLRQAVHAAAMPHADWWLSKRVAADDPSLALEGTDA